MLDSSKIPMQAEVVERSRESESIFTLRLRLLDEQQRRHYRFDPGQFNMVYLHGVGEIPISIVSDDRNMHLLDHTIRVVGRVTRGLEQLCEGDVIGLRGPFGRGWPMGKMRDKDVVVITGGVGCAPVASAISYINRRRARFGHLAIVEGVRHRDDLIYPDRFERWRSIKNTKVLLTSSEQSAPWPWYTGRVTDHLDEMEIDPSKAVAMLCGPEGMMISAAEALESMGVEESSIWLSIERNMQCGEGFCGHCQMGSLFVCRDGPVFNWTEVRGLLKVVGI